MSRCAIIEKLEKTQRKKKVPPFHVGDTVRVHTRIIEGQKERIQMFTGTVIARKGTGLSETFSLHRVAYGEGMERVFLLHSPRISKIEVMKEGHVRRAKLYHLRGTFGKAAKVRGRVTRRNAQLEEQEEESTVEERQQEASQNESQQQEQQENPEVNQATHETAESSAPSEKE